MTVLGVVMGPLYVMLVLLNPSRLLDTGVWLYAASWIIVGHVTWGMYIAQRYLYVPPTPLSGALDASLIALLYLSVYWMDDLFCWSLAFALFFGAALMKYGLLRNSVPLGAARQYVELKLRNEWPAVAFFILIAILSTQKNSHSAFREGLEVSAFIMAMAFLVWLVAVKKAYAWVFRQTEAGQ